MRQRIEKTGWQLLALLVSFALWVTFVGSPELTRAIVAPVEYANMPSDLEVSSELPRTVQLVVRAAGPRLDRLQPSDLAVLLDLEGVQAGERTFTIEARNIHMPAGMKVVRTIPDQLQLKFEKHSMAWVPVRVHFAAPPREGYGVTGVKVQPPTVQVEGPESRVRALEGADADPISLASVLGESKFQVPVYVRDPQVRLVRSPQVLVSVQVAKAGTGTGGAASGGKATVRN